MGPKRLSAGEGGCGKAVCWIRIVSLTKNVSSCEELGDDKAKTIQTIKNGENILMWSECRCLKLDCCREGDVEERGRGCKREGLKRLAQPRQDE